MVSVFHLRSLSSQNRGIYNVTVISKRPRFRDDSDLKMKTETTCHCQARQKATFGVFRRLKKHHYTPHFKIPRNTQNTGYFEKGCVVRDLNDVILNA